MFPSNYVAAHEVKTVTGGHRYSYLGWYAHGTPNQAVGEYVVDPSVSASATNVYMPSLREDVLALANKKDPSGSSHLGLGNEYPSLWLRNCSIWKPIFDKSGTIQRSHGGH